VTSLQSNEILEIFELRAVVEEHAAYRAAWLHVTPPAVAVCASALRVIEKR
jgi:DNA-binding GntR family transcriptional regulator